MLSINTQLYGWWVYSSMFQTTSDHSNNKSPPLLFFGFLPLQKLNLKQYPLVPQSAHNLLPNLPSLIKINGIWQSIIASKNIIPQNFKTVERLHVLFTLKTTHYSETKRSSSTWEKETAAQKSYSCHNWTPLNTFCINRIK